MAIVVDNGTFDTDTVWEKRNTGDPSPTNFQITGGQAVATFNLDSGQSVLGLPYTGNLREGVAYTLTFDVSDVPVGLTWFVNDGQNDYPIGGDGSKSIDIIFHRSADPTDYDFYFYISSQNFIGSPKIDNVSIDYTYKGTVIAMSNKLQGLSFYDCHSKVVKYKDTKEAFGFNYPTNPTFYQQIRLGIYLRSPKYPTKERLYRQSDGVFRGGNIMIDKSYELHTDQWDEPTHDAMAVALKHNSFYIDDVHYIGQGELDMEDNDFNNLSSGKATVLQQGFNQTNISC